jgi:hypothetical protein
MIRRFLLTLLATGLSGALCVIPDVARAQASSPYLGEIQTFAFNFCPAGWAPLNGQLLAISQNQALFCTAWDNVWRRWPEHFCPPDGKADFHGDRGDAYPVHRPTGCFPVAFVRASDHSLSLACRSRCGDKGRGDQRAHASAALRSSGTTAGRRRSQSGQAPPGFPATCRSSEAVRHRG